MLEKIDLSRSLSKKQYKDQIPKLQRRLYDLQHAAWKGEIPSVIVFEGWDAAGKGTTINTLTQRLDPRGFKLHPIQAARTFEKMHPWLWRFWNRLPNYGEMAIFDRSWYGRVLVERVERFTPKREWREAISVEIQTGAKILRLVFHIFFHSFSAFLRPRMLMLIIS